MTSQRTEFIVGSSGEFGAVGVGGGAAGIRTGKIAGGDDIDADGRIVSMLPE
jgi:hypothetical protein